MACSPKCPLPAASGRPTTPRQGSAPQVTELPGVRPRRICRWGDPVAARGGLSMAAYGEIPIAAVFHSRVRETQLPHRERSFASNRRGSRLGPAAQPPDTCPAEPPPSETGSSSTKRLPAGYPAACRANGVAWVRARQVAPKLALRGRHPLPWLEAAIPSNVGKWSREPRQEKENRALARFP